MNINLNLRIFTDSALSIGAGATSTKVGVDKTAARDSKGNLVIPSSTIKGVLRERCENILRTIDESYVCQPPRPENMCPNFPGQLKQDPCPVCEMFGSPWLKSRLFFRDGELDVSFRKRGLERFQTEIRAGVSISRSRRTAAAERLYFVETSLPNAGLVFQSNITGEVPSGKYVALLMAAIQTNQSFGGGRARGLGWTTITLEGEGLLDETSFEQAMEEWYE